MKILIAAELSLIVFLSIYGCQMVIVENLHSVSTMAITTSDKNPTLALSMDMPANTPANTPVPVILPSTGEFGEKPAEALAYRSPRIVFCGDILLDGSVRRLIDAEGLDAVFPAQYRAPLLDADIVMVNLEMPFSDRGAPDPDKEYSFRGDPSGIALLKDMGVSIVSLANNHTLDYGRDAFSDTLELLEGNDIKYVGGGRDKAQAAQWATFLVEDKKIAFLAASRVIPTIDWYATASRSGLFGTYDPAGLNEQITLAKMESDYVFVYVHWGVERNDYPEEYQREMAYGYIDAGADAVVACHPHVLQGFEYYKDKLISYSLGNFIFTDSKKDTAALEFTINGDGSMSARIYPYEIINRSTVEIGDPEKLEMLRGHLNKISFGVEIDDDFNLLNTGSL